ncbi:MAG: HlyC/CorC family transporter [Planctomycetes bacterium]|nr:HlyC/CorC family transporter [Planctomycetota bacterium]
MTAQVLVLAGLLLGSAFFSASETALFSLERGDLDRLRQTDSRGARSVESLLAQPRSLLVAVLFGNLLINFLFAAITSRLTSHLDVRGSVVLGAFAAVALLLVFGEIAPKAVAVARPRQVALLTSPPLLLFHRATAFVGLIGSLERVVGWLLDRVEQRLPPPAGPLSNDELRMFIELQRQEGSLEDSASELLADVLELGNRRVHEVATPRVDLIALDLAAGRDAFFALAREHRLGRILVHKGEGIDSVCGYLSLRDVLREPQAELAQLMRPLWYVPHTKSLESLLRAMITRQEHLALAVGEYGGTVGLVTLEDVVEEITGDIARRDARPLLEELEDGRWRMAGRFPLREAAELLGIQAEAGSTTLSGFVAHRLGRIPEVGDLLWYKGIQFRVDEVERRRATQVRVALPTPGLARPRPAADEDDADDELTRSAAHRAKVRLSRFAETNPNVKSDDGLDGLS